MAQNPLLNELIEERVYPIVDSIKGFFGSFGLPDRLGQPNSNGGSPIRSPTAIATTTPPPCTSARTNPTAGRLATANSTNSSPSRPPPSSSPACGVGSGNGPPSTPLATSSPVRSGNPLHPTEGSAFSYSASSPSTAAGNHRATGVPPSVASGLRQQPTRTGSCHGDLCRTTKARLTDSPLRAISIDATGSGKSPGTGSDTSSPVRQSHFSYGSISSQFRQTFAELGGGGSHSNGGASSSASSVDHDADQDTLSTSAADGNAAAADDSGDGYAAALAASAGAEKLGRLQFSVAYDFDAQTLTVKIIKAESLAAKDLSGTSDPYVKISLLPDKKHTLTTNIKRKNLNPRWNEVFAFEGFPYNKVVMKTLHLLVLDYDRFSRDDPIGEVCLPLGDFDLATGQTMWKTLLPCKGAVGKLGVLQLSLCYQPADESIMVVIMKARDLKAKDLNGLSDPYVKIWLTHEGKRIEKKKTEVKEKTLNPVFDESFLFTIPYERIRQTSLIVSVMDYDRMGRNEAIGQIVLGPKSGPIEMKHWNEMFAKTRQPVTQWHLLKDFG